MSVEERKKLEDKAAQMVSSNLSSLDLKLETDDLSVFAFTSGLTRSIQGTYPSLAFLYPLVLTSPPLLSLQGAKLEVESVIREVCDRVLSPSGVEDTLSGTPSTKVSLASLRKRAVALGILGDVFAEVVKDPGQESPLGPGFGI